MELKKNSLSRTHHEIGVPVGRHKVLLETVVSHHDRKWPLQLPCRVQSDPLKHHWLQDGRQTELTCLPWTVSLGILERVYVSGCQTHMSRSNTINFGSIGFVINASERNREKNRHPFLIRSINKFVVFIIFLKRVAYGGATNFMTLRSFPLLELAIIITTSAKSPRPVCDLSLERGFITLFF